MSRATSTAAPQYVPDALLDRALCRDRHALVDGTLLFADLSNFTPLTERLAKKGQVGSEELTDLLNDLFAPMLDLAMGLGGDLLKFGGDALLIAFTGDCHAGRALQAAAGMRTALRSTTRRRRIKLGMSVGVAGGPIALHLVGHRNLELVVSGPVVDRCLELESAAAEGQILTDRASSPADVVVGNAVHDLGALELIDLRDAPIDLHPPDEWRRSRSESPPLDPLVAAAIAEGATGEHRRAVVAFAGFDVDPADDSETAHRRLEDLVGTAQDLCHEFGVALINCDVAPGGGKLTLTAGVPFTTGDDADRMLQLAIRLTATPAAQAMGVRIGISEGTMFVGPVGSATRRCYTVMGDTVNLSARVMGRASPGVVLATTEVLDRTREVYEIGAIERFTVKGKRAPVSAASVRSPTGRTIARPSTRSIRGRDDELHAIARAVAAAGGRGTGSMIEVTGEAGIGKTRLIDAVIEESPLDVIKFECGRYLAASPYGALIGRFRQLIGAKPDESETEVGQRLRRLVTDSSPELVASLPLIGIPLGISLPDTPETAAIGGDFRLTRMHDAFGRFIDSRLPEPHLVVIEDAHWMDTASGALIDVLAADLVERGWVVVATRRPDEAGWAPSDPTSRIRLAPLDPDAARTLAVDLTEEHVVADHLIGPLVDRSDGNPLFLAELVRAVQGGARVEDLPDRVEVLIEAQIDRLPAASRRTLRVCSVLGARFDLDLLQAIDSAPDPGAARLVELVPFLSLDDGGVRFRHALYRDTAYRTLRVKERAKLHAAAAVALEARAGDAVDEQAELLSFHWFSAQEFERAWPHLLSAARRARADLAPYEASGFLEQALACAGHLGDEGRSARPEVEEELGMLYDTLGRFPEAERCFRRARQHTTDPAHKALLRGLEGRVARSSRKLSTAVRRYRTALVEVPDDAHGVRAQLSVGLAAVLERQGRHHDKLEILHLATSEATKAGDVATLAHAHLVLGNTYGDLGTGQAERHLTTALVLFEQLDERWGVASARNNLGVEAYFAGDWTTALEHYRAALEAYRSLGDESNAAMALTNIGEIHSDQGHWELAGAEFEEARRTWAGSGLGVAFVTSNLGRLACRRGDHERASVEFSEARRGLQQAGAEGYLTELEARVGVLELVRGNADDAWRRVVRVLRHGVDLVPAVRCQLERTAGLAAAALGRPDDAGAHLAEALRLADASGASYERACTLSAFGELNADEFAIRQARTLFEELGVEPVAQRAW